MSLLHEILDVHPQRIQMDKDVVSECISQLCSCRNVCIVCADACLASPDVKDMTRCVRSSLDCGDICGITAEVLLRQIEPNWKLSRKLLEACIATCRICGEECQKHADEHEYCRVCAKACRITEDTTEKLLQEVAAAW